MSEDRSVFEITAPGPGQMIPDGGDRDQVLEYFQARGESKKSIGLIHGGYGRTEFDRTHLRPFAARCAEEGFDTYLIEYRRTQGVPAH